MTAITTDTRNAAAMALENPVQRFTLPSGRNYAAINELVTAPLLNPGAWTWRAWWIGFAISSALTGVFLVCIAWLFIKGVGIWGVNTTVVWGYAIANPHISH
jgi:hypothetical protein